MRCPCAHVGDLIHYNSKPIESEYIYNERLLLRVIRDYDCIVCMSILTVVMNYIIWQNGLRWLNSNQF